MTQFNAMEASELVDQLTGLFASRDLATAVAAARPIATIDALCGAASVLLHEQDDETVLESVNAHPPIGGTVESGSRSAAEQATAAEDQGENGEMTFIRNLQPTYREKFGWNFLVRAAGKDSPADPRQPRRAPGPRARGGVAVRPPPPRRHQSTASARIRHRGRWHGA